MHSKALFSLYAFVLFFNHVQSVIVLSTKDVEEEVEFVVSRYSRFIGDFACDEPFEGNVTLLKSGENLCKIKSFERDLTDQILIVENIRRFGCLEESVYSNMQSLGLRALVNSENRIAGAFNNKHNIRKDVREGDMYLLDTDQAFYEEVFRPLSNGNNVFDDFEGTTENTVISMIFLECDAVQCIYCTDAVQTGLNAFLAVVCFFTFGLAVRSRSAVKGKKRGGVKPRIFVFDVVGTGALFFGILFLFGLTNLDNYVWFFGEDSPIAFPSQIKSTLWIWFLTFTFITTFISAYYWHYLSAICFPSNGVRMVNLDFFESKKFTVLLVFIGGSFILTTFLISIPDFPVFFAINLFYAVELLTVVLFTISNWIFISKARTHVKEFISRHRTELDAQSTRNPIATTNEGTSVDAEGRMFYSWIGESISAYLGRDVSKLFREMKTQPEWSRTTLQITIHLGYCLNFYFFLIFFEGILLFVLFPKYGIENKAEDDPSLENCDRVLLLTVILLGVAGPSKLYKQTSSLSDTKTGAENTAITKADYDGKSSENGSFRFNSSFRFESLKDLRKEAALRYSPSL
eukprot:snap_masked-scaffold_9-processed-gene-1.2-mRNA-1 protein AED:1.00 eAED:1.00 QI:0/0/0/0/1/1/2/0/573